MKTQLAMRTIWVTVARHGWCDLNAVRAECDIDADEVSFKRRLYELKCKGYIAARPIPAERRRESSAGSGSVTSLEYAVTRGCLIPSWLTVEEVVGALVSPGVAGALK